MPSIVPHAPARTEIVSHRGGALLWPENSLLAFRNSLALPIEQLECDVHLSADGVPMVLHDALLDRTTEGEGPLAAQDAAALASLRLRGTEAEYVPRLADLARLLHGHDKKLQVEVKAVPGSRPDPALLRASLAVLDEAGIRRQCRIIAFEAELAAMARDAGGLAGVIWLFGDGVLRGIGAAGVVGVAEAYGIDMVETDIATLDESLLRRLRQAGLKVGVWGANEAGGIRKALALGVDAMATDDPILALRLRDGG